MKSIFKIGLFSLAISLCIGSGAVSLKNEKPATRVEAAGEAWQATNFNNVYYATAKEALDQQGTDSARNIKLLRDTTETDCNIWLTTASVTVDLNGHTLTLGSQGSPIAWFLGFGAGAVTSSLNLTITSSISGGKINAYCANAVLYLDPNQAGYSCTTNIQSGVQIKNFSSGRTVYMHQGTTFTVQSGASVIATDVNQPAITNVGGMIYNYGTLQGATNGVQLEPTKINDVDTLPSITLRGANARVTPRIYSKRSGGVVLSNYSYSENNASVYPVNIVFDENTTYFADNTNVFSNIHWKYKDNFSDYISVSLPGGEHHTLSWYQQTANQTGYLRWLRNTYTIVYNINGGKSGTTNNTTGPAEQYVPLRDNNFKAQNFYFFKEWNTRADGLGQSYQPGESYQLLGNITLYAIWEYDVGRTIEENVTTRSSLAYHYSKDGEGNFTFTNVNVRFGGIITQSLWNALDQESIIIGYGELYSTDAYLGANELKSYYATANSNPNVEIHSYEVTPNPDTMPVLYEDSNYQGVEDDYYVWNIRRSVSDANFKTVYASVAFIITQDDGVIFMEEVRKSVKDLAQDLLDGPNYNNDSLGGSLKHLADL